MILRPSVEFQEPKFGGDESRSRLLPELSFGNKNMPSIGKRRITLECQGKLGAPIFGTLLGKIKVLFSNIVFGKSEQGT